MFNYGPEPSPDMLVADDEELLLSERNDDAKEKKRESNDPNDLNPEIADWRYGPAQSWYDMLGVSDSG